MQHNDILEVQRVRIFLFFLLVVNIEYDLQEKENGGKSLAGNPLCSLRVSIFKSLQNSTESRRSINQSLLVFQKGFKADFVLP